MAGVGFELKKLFKKNDGYVNLFKSYTISAIVTEGPMLLCILMMLVLRYFMARAHATIALQEAFFGIITYTMIFSMLLANSMMMFQSRYISDCLYDKRNEKILPSFFGVSAILLIIGFVMSAIVAFILPLDLIVKVLAVAQFSLVILSWILINYLSSIKLYKEVVYGFAFGAIAAILLGFVLIYLGFNPLTSALLAWSVGYALLVMFFFKALYTFFPYDKKQPIFEFVKALDKYKVLIAIGFFMVLGLFAHNFVLWLSPYHTPVLEKLRYCAMYDVPSFYAVFSITPMLVMFVVSLEVNFYDQYRNYFQTILQGGRYEDIQNAHKNMVRVLYRELAYLFEMRLLVAILSATLLGNVLEYFGLDVTMLGIFRILCFGYTFYGLMRCGIIVQLYFDDRKGALLTSVFFAISSVVATMINLLYPLEFMGFGFCIAAVASAMVALARIHWYLKNMGYEVFCKQPLIVKNEVGFFTRLYYKWGGM